MGKLTSPSYQVNAGDWLQLESIINDLTSRFITQALTPENSPTFAGLTIDALSGILKGTTGVVSTATGGVDYEFPLTFSDSLHRSTNTITLDNDSDAPGNSYYYGTNDTGTKGFFTIASAGGTIDHSTLLNLDYASAGHTGFEPTVSRFNLSGTANQVILTGSGINTLLTNDVQLSLPQDINTTSTVNFQSLILEDLKLVGRGIIYSGTGATNGKLLNNSMFTYSTANTLTLNTGQLSITGVSVSGTSSLDATDVCVFIGGTGGNGGGNNGGKGSDVLITTGNGGYSGNAIPGNGGDFYVQCGTGGESGGPATGGSGGRILLYSGVGTDSDTLNSGKGGDFELVSGTGGYSVGGTGGSGGNFLQSGGSGGNSEFATGGNGGYAEIKGGNGGNSVNNYDIAGNGADIFIYGGIGGTGIINGNNGNVILCRSQNGNNYGKTIIGASTATEILTVGGNIDVGIGTPGIDYYINFNGQSNDGRLTWMEDEDYFKFLDDILMNSTEAVMFNDTSTKLQYSGGDLDLYTTAEKTLELQTVVWNDINMGGAVLAAVPGQQPGRDEFVDSAGTDTGIDTYALAVGEAIDGCFEIMHDYKEGTDLTFHIHWQGIDAPTGVDNVRWQLTYTLSREETVLAAVTSIEVETAFDTQYEFKRSNFAEITGTNFKIGDQFLFKLERIASTGDAYAGEALLATLGIHYQINTLGSRQITTK